MPNIERLRGVLTPVITPFDDALLPDAGRLVDQCRWLLSQDVGLAVFGTNSEANSMSVGEKIDLLDALVDAGLDTSRMMPGTGCCALTDSLRLTRHAVSLGCAGVLMLPPFYYKDVSDDGLYRSYAEIIERTGDAALQIYLYHIPPIANVGLSLDLIERLVRAYPHNIAGIKDSSGDWNNTAAMLERGWDDFRVFAGSESFLLRVMQGGGAGCISATANVNPAAISRLWNSWNEPTATRQQQDLDGIRAIVQEYPMIPALKAIVASFRDDRCWRTVRPPLVNLPDDAAARLMEQLGEKGFDMPGLARQ
ncbi:MAG: dihydrodipicolinate synthase family protein [Gammaproteobacteria bacterium]|nr:dihydrodipicolinate synthase family protein [Gammaproteobacteria bacterium]